MSDAIYIVMERRFDGDISMTPYLSEESAKQHYEETLAVYGDLRKPFYPIHENEMRDHFLYGDKNNPQFECGIYKEEVYA